MTSRTYRGIRIVLFLLLVIACLLVSHAAPSSSATVKGVNAEYNKLRDAILKATLQNLPSKELKDREKCPFKVLNVGGFTRILCDCTRADDPCDRDCVQVYMNATDIITKKKQTTAEDVEMGCIYNPKRANQSIETAGPRTSSKFV